MLKKTFLTFIFQILSIWYKFKKQCPFSRVFIPDENLVWCPENLMTAILAQVHYLPDNWRGNAHTTRVRNEMSQLFQYKAVSLLANTS